MRSYIRRHKWIATVCALGLLIVIGSGFQSPTAPVRGRWDAHRDLRRGHYEVLCYGLPASWRPEYARCLRDRYDIHFRPVAGCIVSESLISYVGAYNSVAEEAALRRFRHDVFQECAEEARTKWRARLEEPVQNSPTRR